MKNRMTSKTIYHCITTKTLTIRSLEAIKKMIYLPQLKHWHVKTGMFFPKPCKSSSLQINYCLFLSPRRERQGFFGKNTKTDGWWTI